MQKPTIRLRPVGATDKNFDMWADGTGVNEAIREDWQRAIGDKSLEAFGLYVDDKLSGRLCLSFGPEKTKLFIESLKVNEGLGNPTAIEDYMVKSAMTAAAVGNYAYVGTANISHRDPDVSIFTRNGFRTEDGSVINPDLRDSNRPSIIAVHLVRPTNLA